MGRTDIICMQTSSSLEEMMSLFLRGDIVKTTYQKLQTAAQSIDGIQAETESVGAAAIIDELPPPVENHYRDELGFIPNKSIFASLRGDMRAPLLLRDDPIFAGVVYFLRQTDWNIAYLIDNSSSTMVAVLRLSGQIALNEALHQYQYWTSERLLRLSNIPYTFKSLTLQFT